MVQKDAHVIYENFIYDQLQRTNQRVLVNVTAENDRYEHLPPLNIDVSEASPIEVNGRRGNLRKKQRFFELEVKTLESRMRCLEA